MSKKVLMYIPHGINSDQFFPIEEGHPLQDRMKELKKTIFLDNEFDFVLFYNNRNIRRKLPSNIIMAFKKFHDSLPKDKRHKVALLFHTQPIDNNGTDLPEVAKAIAPDARIIFSANKVSTPDLNCMYNLVTATINTANAEGFGLATAESLMAGTPFIGTVTGGLQGQMRFTDEDGKWINFSDEHHSNHDGKYKTHAPWAFPIFPAVTSLTGSPPTPYIYEDYTNVDDIVEQIKIVYETDRDKLKELGKQGREWLMTKDCGMNAQEMSHRFIMGMDKTMEEFEPRKKFTLYKT